MTAILIVFLVFLYMVCKGLPEQKAQTKFVCIASFVLILISGLRHEAVGNDTYAYIMNYNNSIYTSWNEILDGIYKNYLNPQENKVKDPGYKVFEKSFRSIIPTARLYLFVIALILISSIGRFVNVYSQNLKTTLFIYIFYVTMFFGYLPNSAIRQSLALSCVLYAYSIFKSKEKNPLFYSIAIILVGSLFHKSALVSILLLFLFRIRNVRMVNLATVFVFAFMLLFASSIASFFAESSGEIYGGYLSGGYYGQSSSKPVSVVFLMALLFGICMFGMRYDNEIEENRLLYYGSALALIFLPLTMVNPSLIRIISYFAFLMGALIGDSLNRIPRGNYYLFGLIMVFFLYSIKSGSDYRFMWEKMKLHDRYGCVYKQCDHNDLFIIKKDLSKIDS